VVSVHVKCTLPDAEPLRCQLVDRCDEYVSNGQHGAPPLEVFAEASGVALGPLTDWLRKPPADTAGVSEDAPLAPAEGGVETSDKSPVWGSGPGSTYSGPRT
jgi:hypothetical protein